MPTEIRETESDVLHHLGWDDHFDLPFAEYRDRGWQPGRIAVQHRDQYRLLTADGECDGTVTGRFRHEASSPADFPAVGDWVAFQRPAIDGPMLIHAVLPRRSKFSRRAAGTVPYEQVLAANVDTVFLVSGLDGNYHLRRIERYVTQAWESGALPVVVLNKADLCEDVDAFLDEVRNTVIGVDVHAVSGECGDGLEALHVYLEPGRTVALVGSSGVGKSTLINRLVGSQRLATSAVRARGDSRGRHTTTHRELVPMSHGSMLIDTPGMRELALWGDEDGAGGDSFEDIESLMSRCRFTDCRHQDEPGCAVQTAIEAGDIDPGRLANWMQMQRELVRQRQREARREAGRMRDDADVKRISRRTDRRAQRRRLREEDDL